MCHSSARYFLAVFETGAPIASARGRCTHSYADRARAPPPIRKRIDG